MTALAPAYDPATEAGHAPATSVPVLRTPRLILGSCTLDHVAAFEAFLRTDASTPLGGPSEDRADAWFSCATHAGQWILRGYGSFWLVEADGDGTPVGRVGLWHPTWLDEPELSWVVYPAFQRRGYAVEAAAAVRDWAATRGIGPLMSLIAPDNAASLATARRLGARREGVQHGRAGKPVELWRHPAGAP